VIGFFSSLYYNSYYCRLGFWWECFGCALSTSFSPSPSCSVPRGAAAGVSAVADYVYDGNTKIKRGKVMKIETVRNKQVFDFDTALSICGRAICIRTAYYARTLRSWTAKACFMLPDDRIENQGPVKLKQLHRRPRASTTCDGISL
jgi:hypothetical protein